MTRKGIVDQFPISRMPSRFTPTNTAQVMSSHDDRSRRRTRRGHLLGSSRPGGVTRPRSLAAAAVPMLAPPLIPDTAFAPPATRHQVTPDAYPFTPIDGSQARAVTPRLASCLAMIMRWMSLVTTVARGYLGARVGEWPAPHA